MYTIISLKNIGHHARLKEKDISFAIELRLREISSLSTWVYMHALICAR